MADVKWIKITTDIFDDEKILLIESMPDADAVIVIWFKLLCLAGKMNNSGVFVMAGHLAYTDEMLATIFRRPVNTVRMALNVFNQFGMVEIIDGVITIPNWGKHQNLDALAAKAEYMRGYMQEYRKKQKLMADDSKANCKTNSKANVSEADKNREEKDKNRTDKNTESIVTRHKYGLYENVLLSDVEMESLKVEFPDDYEQRIERLSEYIAMSGKKYKNFSATIKSWARKDAEEQRQKEVLPF